MEQDVESDQNWQSLQSKNKELKRKKNIYEQWQNLEKLLSDIETAVSMSDEEFLLFEDHVETTLKKINILLLEAEKTLFLQGKYDSGDAFLEIHVGNGGDDAEDFCQMLLRMYLRFCERKDWKTSIIDQNETPSGIKSVTLKIEGEYVYGYFQHEKGVHRLIRISPFKSTDSRQTSFASIVVTPLIDEAGDMQIKEEDLRIDTYRAGGAGGQKVNKTDSAIRITHLSTGIVVQCQNERSQLQNKQQAMMMLRSKLFQKEQERKEEEMRSLQGENKKAEFGSQIRTYTLQPYRLVKDHRTNAETSNVDAVFDGDLDLFFEKAIFSS